MAGGKRWGTSGVEALNGKTALWPYRTTTSLSQFSVPDPCFELPFILRTWLNQVIQGSVVRGKDAFVAQEAVP